MKKIIAFAGSNSSSSINHQLTSYVTSGIENHRVELIKLTDYPLPLFSVDIENDSGYPDELRRLRDKIKEVDGLIISVNEHNGNVSAFFKNVMDWMSRLEYKFLEDKKVLLLSTSPGRRGALSANEYVQKLLPRFNGEVVASMPFPLFEENFSIEENKIINNELQDALQAKVELFLDSL